MTCSECPQKSCVGIVMVATFVVCTIAAAWMSARSTTLGKAKQLNELLACARGAECKGDSWACTETRRKCRIEGWSMKIEPISSRCAENPEIHRRVQSAVGSVSKEQRERFKRGLSRDIIRLMKEATEAFYKSARIIIQWFPYGYEGRSNASRWRCLKNYEHHRSTFTVSSGPEGCYDNGVLIVPETGEYHVYAKVTLSCTLADLKHKHVHMNVTVGESGGRSSRTILWDQQSAVCAVKGDLVTMYQSGLFRLDRGNKIVVAYKAPEDVFVSSGRHEAFKSILGMYRVGPLEMTQLC